LLVEWPEARASSYRLSTLPGNRPIEVLVDATKTHWRIEHDYEEMKGELSLAHFEGRGWRGFHHHNRLCIVAYGFLIRERATLPP
jgi:SRSO17 transposase